MVWSRREICAFLSVLMKLGSMSKATKLVLGTVGASLVLGVVIVATIIVGL